MTTKATKKKAPAKKAPAKKAPAKKAAPKQVGSGATAPSGTLPLRSHRIGIMDPNSYSFRLAVERLFDFADFDVEFEGARHRFEHRRIMCRPYRTLGAETSCEVILNRGAHWNPHHNSFFTIVGRDTYLVNDMISFKAIDKNVGYGHMHDLGLKIPETWALPQEDYSEIHESPIAHPELIFSEHELFDLAAIGEQVGYPAFLKPQDGGGWVGVEKVNGPEDLLKAYAKSGKKPMNLQKAVDYVEFVRSVGVGPCVMPMHYNADAPIVHDRYIRGENCAADPNFLAPEVASEVKKICKIINAFYGWDHNSCETLITSEGDVRPIDFANAYPDSTVISLHFFFPELVKAMVRWLAFCAVAGRKKPVNFSYQWDRWYEVRDRSKKEKWSYAKTLDAYEALADEHFETARFDRFCNEALRDFDAKALAYFESDAFDEVLAGKVAFHFKKVPHEIPQQTEHYRGIHRYWCHCERERLGL